MKSFALAAALMTIAAFPASAQPVSVAGGNWDNIPAIDAKGEYQMSTDTMERLAALAEEKVCDVPGFKRNRINLTVPFLVQFDAQKTVQRVVVARLGCTRLEQLLGGAALQLSKMGEYTPTGENQTGWYRSELSFSLR